MNDLRRVRLLGGSALSWFVDAAVGLLVVVMFWLLPWTANPARDASVLVSLSVVVVAAVVLRWRWPLAASFAAFVATAAGWVTGASTDPMIAAAWCLYPLALRGNRARLVGPLAVLLVMCSAALALTSAGSDLAQRGVTALGALGAAWLLGRVEAGRLGAARRVTQQTAEFDRMRTQATMAREVHDVVGHALTVISAEADAARNLPGSDEQELRESLADIERRARGALEDVQALVRFLRTGVDGRHENETASAALPRLVAAAQVSGLAVTADVDLPDISPETDRVTVRVVQEALSNVLRHSRARHCDVVVRPDGDTLAVRVDDDGTGFPSSTQLGNGLAGMRERVAEAGGDLTVTARYARHRAASTRIAIVTPIRVFLVDDDKDFRRIYRRVFDRSEGFQVADEAGTTADALRMIPILKPDVALVDVQMPDGTGLEVLRGVVDTMTRVIILTTFDLDEYVAEAIQEGAAGFLLKNASSAEVLAAVQAVHAGHSSLAPEVTARLLSQFAARPRRTRHAFAEHRLSQRELDVIRLVASGNSNQQIAQELHLSLATVRTYLRRLFVKLDVNDRTRLAILAHQAGLLRETR